MAGRRAKMKVGRWTTGVKRDARWLEREMVPLSERSAVARVGFFLRLCRYNRCALVDLRGAKTAVLRYVAAQRRAGVRWGTLGVYLRQIRTGVTWPVGAGRFWADLLKYVDGRHAESGGGHAASGTLDVLTKQCLEMEDPQVRAAALLMLYAGLRARDVGRLTSAQVEIDERLQRITIEVRRAKNIKRRSDTRQVRVLLAWFAPEVRVQDRREVLGSLAAYYKTAEPWPRERGALSATISKALEKPLTSYTLRRCFVQRVVELHTNQEEVIDWAGVMKLTLHEGEDTLRAYYAVKVSDQ